jgi:hypothetical protein
MPTIFEARRKLEDFANLSNGWNFGKGVPAARKIIALANGVLDRAEDLGFQVADAFPGVSGEVQINLYHGEHYFEFIIDAPERVTFVYEQADEEKECLEGVTLFTALSALERIAPVVCNFSEFSTDYGITIKSNDALPQSRFAMPAMAPASLSSNWIAPYNAVPMSASISKPFIEMSLASLQSTGNLTKATYQPIAPLRQTPAIPETTATTISKD